MKELLVMITLLSMCHTEYAMLTRSLTQSYPIVTRQIGPAISAYIPSMTNNSNASAYNPQFNQTYQSAPSSQQQNTSYLPRGDQFINNNLSMTTQNSNLPKFDVKAMLDAEQDIIDVSSQGQTNNQPNLVQQLHNIKSGSFINSQLSTNQQEILNPKDFTLPLFTPEQEQQVKQALHQKNFYLNNQLYSSIQRSVFQPQIRNFSTHLQRQQDEEKVAWHEAGHAVAMALLFCFRVVGLLSIKSGRLPNSVDFGGMMLSIDIAKKRSIDENYLSEIITDYTSQPRHLDQRHIEKNTNDIQQNKLPATLENRIISMFAGPIAEYMYAKKFNYKKPTLNIDSFEKFIYVNEMGQLGGGISFIEATDIGAIYSLTAQYFKKPYSSYERMEPDKRQAWMQSYQPRAWDDLDSRYPRIDLSQDDPMYQAISRCYQKALIIMNNYEPALEEIANKLMQEKIISGDLVYEILKIHKPLFNNEEGPLPELLSHLYKYRGNSIK